MTIGTVIEFDESVGLGTIVAEDGATYGFHCIEITDGTRSIEVGRRVEFRSLPRFGRIQAGDVRKT